MANRIIEMVTGDDAKDPWAIVSIVAPSRTYSHMLTHKAEPYSDVSPVSPSSARVRDQLIKSRSHHGCERRDEQDIYLSRHPPLVRKTSYNCTSL